MSRSLRTAAAGFALLAACFVAGCSTQGSSVDVRLSVYFAEPHGGSPEEAAVIRENMQHVTRTKYAQHFDLELRDPKAADVVVETNVSFSVFESGVTSTKGRAWPLLRSGAEASEGSGRFVSDITSKATNRQGQVLASAVFSQPLGGVEGRGNYESPGTSAQPVTRELLNQLIEVQAQWRKRLAEE